ncbi:MAG: aminotransferase class I/II-fold pyridoxal phosphate-dependent enzyme [Candidatus Marinimicrobia bacterium]|nr:aminotransferase class I/II-fold pyridoxal phosphate-dependent enzyme [Candidatus Neomarinimicrobiota bacterium]
MPGVGRIQARPFSSIDEPEDYLGRICYNENPLGPSPLGLQALRDEAVLAHRYPNWLNTNVESVLAEYYEMSSDQFCVGAGATEMIQKVADAFLGPEDEVITAYPSYTQIANQAITNGGTAVYVPLDENYDIDLSAILDAVTENTTLISLVNPNNPLGRIFTSDDFASFMDQVPEGIVVCVDEAYYEYVTDPNYETVIPYIQDGKPVVVIRTFSKVYGLAGERIGYTISTPELTDQIEDVQLYATVTRTSQAAAIASLEDIDHIDATLSLNQEAKSILYAGFDNLGLSYIPSETSFMMVDCGVEVQPVAEALSEAGYIIRHGWDMPNHLRVSTGTIDEMNGFIEALGNALESVSVQSNIVPLSPGIKHIYPNPFNQSCKIKITSHENEKVLLIIYDTLGRKVMTLANQTLTPGNHEFSWNGKNIFGKNVASGTYLLHMIHGEFVSTQSLQLVK